LLGLDVLQVPYKAKLELRPVPDSPANPLALGIFRQVRDQVRKAMNAGTDIIVKSVSGA
jgi:hypothetical protein